MKQILLTWGRESKMSLHQLFNHLRFLLNVLNGRKKHYRANLTPKKDMSRKIFGIGSATLNPVLIAMIICYWPIKPSVGSEVWQNRTASTNALTVMVWCSMIYERVSSLINFWWRISYSVTGVQFCGSNQWPELNGEFAKLRNSRLFSLKHSYSSSKILVFGTKTSCF